MPVQRFREYGRVAKSYKAWYTKIAILYPSSYEAALASLAHQSLYYICNSYDDVVADRIVFEPDSDSIPRSIEYGMNLRDFDAILASLHFEPDIVKMASMLIRSGINPITTKRTNPPILLVGGPIATANPLLALCVADAAFIGEFEPSIDRILGIVVESRGDRGSMLEGLADVDGVYVHGLSRTPVRRVYQASLDNAYHPILQLQPLDREPIWGRSMILEASRGCPHRCLFCLEGYIFKPKRDRSFTKIKLLIEEGVKANNVRKITFYAPSFFDHKDSDKLLEWLIDVGLEASIPSLRLDTIGRDRLEAIARVGQRMLTLAPESGFCPLASILGKPYTREGLSSIFSEAYKMGFKELKLYFLVGFFEGEEKYILDAVCDAVEAGFRYPSSIKLSINPVIPKPHTPFQWRGLKPLEFYRRIRRGIGESIDGRIVDADFYDERWAQIQTILSLGGLELAELIARWALYGGG
ncbi:MAG: radical SAM protein, partial [Candidatus Bathyarchaeia archaeon]